MNHLVFVGEDNPYGSAPEYALYAWPRNASGNNLRRHLGLTDVEYMHLKKVNLCPARWSARAARAGAAEILDGRPRVVVMLGAKVKKAFGLEELPWFTSAVDRASGAVLVSLPHPSGLCRVWSEPGARRSARGILKLLVPEVPWGESSD